VCAARSSGASEDTRIARRRSGSAHRGLVENGERRADTRRRGILVRVNRRPHMRLVIARSVQGAARRLDLE